MSPVASVPGRTVVAERAHTRVLQALAAEELGIAPGHARIALRDVDGLIGADVVAPIAIPRPPDSVLGRIEAARARLQVDGGRISGAAIADVSIRITDVLTQRRGR